MSAVTIAPFAAADRAAWERLARGYKDFYETVLPPEDYDRTWQRLLAGEEIHGRGAYVDGRLIGIAHFLFHGHIWEERICYLQDLFVDEAIRGKGTARALIDAVADEAVKRGASRYYWQTKTDNARARALYDKVARFRGFIRYDYPLK